MARYFIHTGEGIEFASTEDEARKVANESLEIWRGRARTQGEWDDEAADVYWGEMYEHVRAVSVGKDGDYTDYQLRPVKRAEE